MQPPIRQEDRAGDPSLRLFGHGLGQFGHHLGAAIVGRIGYADAAHLGVGARLKTCGQRIRRRSGHRRAIAKPLTGAFILDDYHDIRQRRAILFLINRPHQGPEDDKPCQSPKDPPRQPAPDREGKTGDQKARQSCNQQHRQKRVKDQRCGHWPNLSSKAGTCT